jgi:hypothetical protein
MTPVFRIWPDSGLARKWCFDDGEGLSISGAFDERDDLSLAPDCLRADDAMYSGAWHSWRLAHVHELPSIIEQLDDEQQEYLGYGVQPHVSEAKLNPP